MRKYVQCLCTDFYIYRETKWKYLRRDRSHFQGAILPLEMTEINHKESIKIANSVAKPQVE
jgi:hypothetical protein